MEKEEEKVGERRRKKEELLGIKLRGGILVGKRGLTSTPSPTWRFGFLQSGGVSTDNKHLIHHHHSVSARKLAANLWEVSPLQFNPKATTVNMNKGGGGGGGGGGSRVPYSRHYKHKGEGFQPPSHHEPPPDEPHEEPDSDSSLRRHVASSLMQHHRSVERNRHHALQTVSPASYSSSMEIAPYDTRGRIREPSFNLKTSTELLKVLNRIYTLEEQHASNMSLVNSLKRELDHSRLQIKELLREKQKHRQEIDEVMKQFSEDKVIRRNKEQDRIKSALESAREELESERKLRKHSESLHRKLAREISDLKSSLSGALKDLQKEEKTRRLLEDLCDEFAVGIRDYEQEVRSLKQHKPEKEAIIKMESPDRLILHLSEAWLDERMQMKICDHDSSQKKNTVVERLSLEIETFLDAKNRKEVSSSKKPSLRRHSLESFHLSAPRDADDDDDDEKESSDSSDSNCFELMKASNGKLTNTVSKQPGNDSSENQKVNTYPAKKNLRSRGIVKEIGSKIEFRDGEESGDELNGGPQKHEKDEVSKKMKGKGKKKKKEVGMSSNQMLNNLMKSRSLFLEGGGYGCPDDSSSQVVVQGHPSPIQPWISKFPGSNTELQETSSRWAHGTRDNTLKEKLIEARLEGQRSHSKASRGSA